MLFKNYQAQGQISDLAIHTLGWKAFQDLCAQVCAEAFKTTVSVYREAQDGGQDAVFMAARTDEDGSKIEVTVQCKFTSKAEQRLQAKDIDAELDAVRKLVLSGRARIYYFITSQGVDAPVAAKIRDKLIHEGVTEPHVLGREWLTLQIRGNARLRALVPRVYGLGDLSTILDERCVQQTIALLGHLRPGLRVYVPTMAHRTAVRVLSEHNIVLLLGAPASGKSMLAGILATTAIDNERHECLKCDGPLELIARWNPHEKNRLYWIDDAFGPNQLRHDFVDGWISAMPKLKTAMEHGNRFILTSRSHIWHGAKPKLGTRNLPVLVDGKATVDLGSLSLEEREQIIYNHIKAGNQPKQWKLRIKPHLPHIAQNPRLLPEIARRLGDSSFTKAVIHLPEDLEKFVSEPTEFLVQTIRELDDPHQAAMTLVFLRRGKLPTHELNGDAAKLVAEKYGIKLGAIAEALPQLEWSFLSVRHETTQQVWGFVHPTFTDAISNMLSKRPDLVDLYVQGSKLDTLLSEAVCEGAPPIRDAVVIPDSASEHLVQRLLETGNSLDESGLLYEFLSTRASNKVIIAVLDADHEVLRRETQRYRRVWVDQKIRLFARVHKLHRLPDDLREEVACELEQAAIRDFDISFLREDDILGLFTPPRLIKLGAILLKMLDGPLSDRIQEIEADADPEEDIPDQFDEARTFVDRLSEFFEDDDSVRNELDRLSEEIDEAIGNVTKRKSSEEDDGSWWSNVPPAKVASMQKGRSTFSDVDE